MGVTKPAYRNDGHDNNTSNEITAGNALLNKAISNLNNYYIRVGFIGAETTD